MCCVFGCWLFGFWWLFGCVVGWGITLASHCVLRPICAVKRLLRWITTRTQPPRWDFRYIFKIAIYTLASKDSLFSPTFSSSTSAAIAPKESQLIEKVLWTGNWQLQELSPLIWFLLGKQQAPRVFLSEIKKLRLLYWIRKWHCIMHPISYLGWPWQSLDS